MINKKVLIISPTPTHPTNAGNRVGVLNVVNYFKRQGCKVFFCYIDLENYSHHDMVSYFEGDFEIIENKILNDRSIFNLCHKLSVRFTRFKYWLKYKTYFISENEWRYNSTIDNVVSRSLIKSVRKLSIKSWDIVVCEYVWISKLLTLFPEKTLKIIDTHDKFTNRYEVYSKMDIKPDWVSLYSKEELKGLNRSDLILTLNDEDTTYFKNRMNKRICKFHYVPQINLVRQKKFSYTLLYFASNNVNNFTSISKFIVEIFPSIKKEINQIKLLIGGSICEKLKVDDESIVLIGKIEDPIDFYCLGDISINPEISGTGFKIKVMEAMSYGIPVISTLIGKLGLESDIEKNLLNPTLVAQNAEDYINQIEKLADDNYYSNVVRTGADFIRKINIKLETDLNKNIIQLLNEKKDCNTN